MRIYVGNFDFQTTEENLREVFQPHGEVKEIIIIRDRDTGRSKGFAFVDMTSNEEAQAAMLALNGKELAGRSLTVNEAKPRPERNFGFAPRFTDRSPGEFGNRGGGFRNAQSSGGFRNAQKKNRGRSERW